MSSAVCVNRWATVRHGRCPPGDQDHGALARIQRCSEFFQWLCQADLGSECYSHHGGTRAVTDQRNMFIVQEPGCYRLWAAATAGHRITIQIHGVRVGLDSDSCVGPWSDLKVEGDRELAAGDVVTVAPAHARLIVSGTRASSASMTPNSRRATHGPADPCHLPSASASQCGLISRTNHGQTIKKAWPPPDDQAPDLDFLVAGAGFEPATSGL
jgi:hypothetical protein